MTNFEKMTDQEIIKIVKKLGQCKMRPSSHGYDKTLKGETILCAATKQLKNPKSEMNAAIAVMGVVLGANRNWEKVVAPNLERLRTEKYSQLTFSELQKMLKKMDFKEFEEVWGHRDERKYSVLSELVEKIIIFSKRVENANLKDVQLMKSWVEKFKLADRNKENYPGRILYFGIATFQHLRMTFGIDTVKPDLRVLQVLEKEFGKKLSPIKAIAEVERMAEITGKKVVLLDQIFVKYGSGHLKARKKQRCLTR